MKNALLILMIAFVATIGCKQEFAKEYSCTRYSVECELEKDNILILPLEFHQDQVVDAYGSEISHAYQWYLINKKVNALAPVFINTGMTGNPTPEALIEQLKEGNDSVRIDTVSLNNRIPGLNKVLLLVTGDHEIKTSTSTEFPSRTVWVASPSPK
ncbi:hypothetical protein IPF86_00015 [Candidatus Nomurabacteria bacterium]|jgi:hypothetical protein|nr:MAG: hypothetical protein IPF86_00015 [Candidatus Nomurabacteria bacterium]